MPPGSAHRVFVASGCAVDGPVLHHASITLRGFALHTGIAMNRDQCTVLSNIACISAGPLRPWQERLAKQMMLDSLDTGIAVSTLADACAMSRSHFTRKFKQSTGLAPQEWLRQQRVRRSKELLATSTLLLVDIAVACGFYDQPHFCRVFMKTEGVTPHTWQMQARSAA
ncbi:helix-turn-helix transcriptional regulator [Pseudomonas sp. Bi70]|uniref:helix-turn-helix transcriptional regulator n=2 Tax=unclassified Pseudomonas TaxID=196821 RepID=UPI0034162362